MEPQRVEAVRGDARDGDLGSDAERASLYSAVTPTEVVMVHGLAEDQVAVRVETADQLFALMVQVRLDCVTTPFRGISWSWALLAKRCCRSTSLR